jgi:hypothetical protein
MANPTASLINFGSVDATYPVAGQDNNSQGFRDNFGVIKTGLGQASTEITALQNNAAFKNSANDFGQNVLSNAVYKTFYGAALDLGSVVTNTDVSLTNGPLQSVTLATNATLTFKNWPTTGKYAAVRVMLYSDQTAVRIPTFSTENAGTIRYDVAFPTLPNSPSTKGLTVGGESLATAVVGSPGSGYTSAATVVFSGGGLQTNGSQATGTATYTCVSATIVGGYSGNGYKLNDQIVVNANTGIVLQVSALNQTFTANTTNNQANLTNVTDFRNIAANVAITGAGIPPGTTVLSFSTSAGTITMSANAQATASGVTVTYTTSDSTGPIGGLIVSSGGTLPLPLGVTSYATSPIVGIGQGARVIMGFGIGGINITNYGDGYTSAPSVSFNPTGGGSNTTIVTTITALTGDNPKVIEAWTRDAGANVYLRYIGEYN